MAKSPERIILGLDPGTNVMGYGLITAAGSKYELLQFGVIDAVAITGEPDVEFARRLLTEHGVAAIPPSVFYHRNDDHKVLRFCFAKSRETLETAAGRLCAVDATA